MIKEKNSVYQNETTPLEILTTRPELPADYHTTDFTENFLGEIFDLKTGRYYSQNARYRYYPKQKDKHLCPGHWQGYRWAIQNLTQPGDWVFDPTCGTGTTLVEAYNHGRHSAGVELEFPKIARTNVDFQKENPGIKTILMQGDARNTTKNLEEMGIERGQLSLVINGTPYPKINGKSSDAPERKLLVKKESEDGTQKTGIEKERTFDYQNSNNIGLTKGDEYWSLVNSMYSQSIEFLKPGGYFVILIKDMIQKKTPYLLSSMIANEVLKNNEDVEYHGLYLHRHIPETMFMRTYPKMYPGVPVPAYQAGIILKKKM